MSDAGSERMLQLRPTMDAVVLRADLDRVGEVLDLIAMGETIPYDRMSDVRGLLSRTRIEGNFLSAPTCSRSLKSPNVAEPEVVLPRTSRPLRAGAYVL
ncbi:MAG: hypothetical protein IPM83_15215 [Ignavibacteria bacterium]|nr:hypothetical protein [Ignavibacteria bacterium]